jgi:RNA-directed DNA polymerase
MPLDPQPDIIRRCANHVGLTVDEVLAISSNAPRRYKTYEIPKRSGSGTRTISHPARELKALQYFFLRGVLSGLPVHAAAMAYKHGASIKANAAPHANSRVILKLDFDSFFPSLRVDNWTTYVSDYFPNWTDAEIEFSRRVLFWGEGGRIPKCLAIGAPTSPHISNLLMYELDDALTEFADVQDIVYTRYADDITFSSQGFINKEATIGHVRQKATRLRYAKLQLNDAKTNLISKAFSRRVTGIVITNSNGLSLGRNRKRLISAMTYRASRRGLDAGSIGRLQGFLAFALDVEPSFVTMLERKYGRNLIRNILSGPR